MKFKFLILISMVLTGCKSQPELAVDREIILVNAGKVDRRLQPPVDSLEQLTNIDGLKFHLPPNSVSDMRLRIDDIKGPPILDYNHMFRNHKIKSYHTKAGLATRAEELGKIIETDLSNIESFVNRRPTEHTTMHLKKKPDADKEASKRSGGG